MEILHNLKQAMFDRTLFFLKSSRLKLQSSKIPEKSQRLFYSRLYQKQMLLDLVLYHVG